ncbi:cyclopropane-fatty-acyl-phospholipid synthase family protein [Marinimicrobium sp. ABcell2]|uniref:SAM-dependent methyltransferase n=1 Tax=Marinimicrobium sp. ABcell2 TaxID=3069751 RepID=UPI0027B56C06|nr:class I SAM-dependent methyltransferase [Marinimicrobium sp. ABcell2]MDQ2078218.1 class I SAM-dependent methyltransferase [Marinimicrobium sp. ABcell2]
MRHLLPLRDRTRLRALTLPVCLAATLLMFSYAAGAQRPNLDVPYVPTPPEVVDRMLEMAEVQPDDFLVDLGSGDGRIVIAAARDYGVRNALGIDLDPERVSEARQNARAAGVEDQVTFEEGDLFEKDFSDATVLTMYLLQSVNRRLKPVILETMAPGTRVVSHDFDMGDWEPDQEDRVSGRRILMWTVPAKVAGRWKITTAEGEEGTVFLHQQYQTVSGEVVINGRRMELQDGRLQGEELSFTVEGERYVGMVNEDSIEAAEGHHQAREWHAQRL